MMKNTKIADETPDDYQDTGLICDDIRDCPPTLDEVAQKAARVNDGATLYCTICDSHGKVLRKDTIANAYNKNEIRLMVQVILLNGRGEILMQQRAASCVEDPLFWDTAAAGHVDYGETPRRAARRELREETGLRVVRLKHIGELFNVVNREPWGELKTYTHVFAARVRGSAERINKKLLEKSEVAAAKWASRAEFNELKPLGFYALFAVECLAKTKAKI